MTAGSALEPGVIVRARPWHRGRQLAERQGYVAGDGTGISGDAVLVWFPGLGSLAYDEEQPSSVQGLYLREITVTGDLRSEPFGVAQELARAIAASGQHPERRHLDAMIVRVLGDRFREGRTVPVILSDRYPYHLEPGSDYVVRHRAARQGFDRESRMGFTGLAGYGKLGFDARGPGRSQEPPYGGIQELDPESVIDVRYTETDVAARYLNHRYREK